MLEANAFEARALQHEIDHCDGLLFLDRAAGAHAIYARADLPVQPRPGIPIGRGSGLKNRAVWVRVPVGAPHVVAAGDGTSDGRAPSDRPARRALVGNTGVRSHVWNDVHR